jgi:galactokinase
MTGGGFGGAAIALLPAELEHAATEAVHAAFAASGFRAPNVFTVTPSEGARRDA